MQTPETPSAGLRRSAEPAVTRKRAVAQRRLARRLGRAGALAAAVPAALAIAACGSSSSSSPSATGATATKVASGGGKTVCVAMKTQLQPRWAFDFRSMSAELQKFGDKVRVEWANDDPSRQASQVESLLSEGCDAMILTPVDDKAAAAQVAAAKAQNVPVVSYDIVIQSKDVSYVVERNNPQVGLLQAQAAAKFTKDSGNWALIKGDAANSVARDISNAYTKVLAGKPNVHVVYNQYTKNWDPSTALSTAEDVLSRYNDNIQAFVTSNDGMAASAAQSLQERHLAGKVFVSGLDGDPANLRLIAEGRQTMTVWTPIQLEAKAAADAANALAHGQKPSGQQTVNGDPATFIPVQEVNKSNLCQFVKSTAPPGWANASTVFAGTSQACTA